MKIIISLMLLSSLLLLSSFTINQNKILGNWFATDMENSTVKIYKAKDGFLYGKITASDKKSWIGKAVLRKLRYDKSKNHWTGTVTALRINRNFNATVTLPSNNKLKLTGSTFLMSKTFYMARK